ncbi:FAD-dependent oxidoreductase [Agromyces sp. NPDC056965]|uniref:FAD-dependent oxidoreductase n=1 Tax=Agromyces sp. NPDC056965 TaxID=3345983 RepID=UPI0036435336
MSPALPESPSATSESPATAPRTTVVVGGVAGGMSAATRLRRLDEEREIIVLERSSEVSFANCGLPYHVSGVIADRDALSLQSPERLAARFRIDARVRHEAVAIDRAARTVTVRRLDDDTTSEIRYDELVLSPGAAPRRLANTSTDAPVRTLRTLDDLDRIMADLDAMPASGPVVVIGGGFIGIEMADNLLRRGLDVALVQRGAHLLAELDEEMASPIADHLVGLGIDVRLGQPVVAIDADHVLLGDGSRLPAALVITAIGVTPEASLAADAGIAIGASGGIAVDAFHRTSDPAIFAIGDAAEKRDANDGTGTLTTLAGLANRHGRAVADTIAGTEAPSRPALGTSIVDAAGLTAASVGWSERVARERGREVRVIHTHPFSHATYYPGAAPLSLKLVIDAHDDRILGAQAVGTDGVDKRIDVIATAMSIGLAASALADLELAYAPQYGSAKDPINMLGYVARNLASGEDRVIQWHELEHELATGAVLLDVRAEAQLAEGRIPGSRWIPVESLRERHAEFAGRRVVVQCRVGQGAHTAARLLAVLGHDVVNLDGGYLTWRDGRRARALAELPLAA